MTSLRQAALTVVRTLGAGGHEAFFAGGCVRDMLLGLKPKDYDVATSALPGEVEKLFAHTVAVGKAFGVIRVQVGVPHPQSSVLSPQSSIEVATFRTEGAYRDGRRPSSVRFTSAREDAERRDFTINGLFYDPVRRKLLDFVEGEADLRRRRLRAIGDPIKRFQEDHLRLLRCIRLAAQLDFQIESMTWRALMRKARQIRSVSAERVRDELTKLVLGPNETKGFSLLLRSGLLHWILPEIEAMRGVAQPRAHHPEGDVFVHTLRVLQNISPPSSFRLAWAALLHDVGKPPTFEKAMVRARRRIRFPEHARVGAEIADRILKKLRFSTSDREAIVGMVANHMTFKDVKAMRLSTLKRLLARPTFQEELALHRADCLGCHGNLSNVRFLQRKCRELSTHEIRPPRLVTGQDLIAMGLKPGPIFGQILASVEEAQLEGRLKTRQEALEFLQSQPMEKRRN